MMNMKKKALLLTAAILAANSALAATQLSLIDDPVTLSEDTGDYSFKAKIVRLSTSTETNGRLISVFGDAQSTGETVYDVKADSDRPARDIFITYSDDEGVTWSTPFNISNTADLSSFTADWLGDDGEPSEFYGDSDKPNIFNFNNMVAVSWVDKYCDSGVQSSIVYTERNNREVPYSCTYVARSSDGGTTWLPAERLTDGSRDAKQDAIKGNGTVWAITWQEDPAGLDLGEADGPGDGASGATVAHGTDIWYSYITGANFSSDTATFVTPMRVTNNYTKDENKQGTSTPIESGTQGASRANLGLAGPTMIVAYEETKGIDDGNDGKVIRYQSFAFNAALTDDDKIGCILSNPAENARRVRFLPQGTAGTSGTKLFIFWKEGTGNTGAPADIMGRSATSFTDVSTFSPALNVPTDTDQGCLELGDDTTLTGAYGNTLGLNLSAGTISGTNLLAATSEDPYENALAHRGYISKDTIVLGYSYSAHGNLADIGQDNYDFYIRRSLDGGATWSEPTDMTSALIDEYVAQSADYDNANQLTIKEPRIVKAPGNGATCPDGIPVDDAALSECSNSSAFIVGGGIIENNDENGNPGANLDLFITRSLDEGDTYEAPIMFAGTADEEFESQIRMTPAVDKVFAVWNSASETSTDAKFVAMDVAEVDESTTRGGGASTSYLFLMLLAGLSFFARKRQRKA